MWVPARPLGRLLAGSGARFRSGGWACMALCAPWYPCLGVPGALIGFLTALRMLWPPPLVDRMLGAWVKLSEKLILFEITCFFTQRFAHLQPLLLVSALCFCALSSSPLTPCQSVPFCLDTPCLHSVGPHRLCPAMCHAHQHLDRQLRHRGNSRSLLEALLALCRNCRARCLAVARTRQRLP